MPWKARTHGERMRERLGRSAADAEYESRRRMDPALAEARRLRRMHRWRVVRAMKLARDPLCEDCLERNRGEPAAQVHHVLGLAERPDLAFDMANLRSLCTGCHALREGRKGRP